LSGSLELYNLRHGVPFYTAVCVKMYAINMREFRSEPERQVLPSLNQALPTECASLTEVEYATMLVIVCPVRVDVFRQTRRVHITTDEICVIVKLNAAASG